MISKTVSIKCGWCKQKAPIENWDKTTYEECKSREQRRAYTSLLNEKAFYGNSNVFYKCPSCGTWSRGCQLSIVDTDDKHLLKLGNQPVINEVNKDKLSEDSE